MNGTSLYMIEANGVRANFMLCKLLGDWPMTCTSVCLQAKGGNAYNNPSYKGGQGVSVVFGDMYYRRPTTTFSCSNRGLEVHTEEVIQKHDGVVPQATAWAVMSMSDGDRGTCHSENPTHVPEWAVGSGPGGWWRCTGCCHRGTDSLTLCLQFASLWGNRGNRAPLDRAPPGAEEVAVVRHFACEKLLICDVLALPGC